MQGESERLKERLKGAMAEDSTVDLDEHAERIAAVVERARAAAARARERELLAKARRR